LAAAAPRSLWSAPIWLQMIAQGGCRALGAQAVLQGVTLSELDALLLVEGCTSATWGGLVGDVLLDLLRHRYE